MNMTKIGIVSSVVALAGLTTAVAGGVKVTNDKGQWLEIGGRIQLQYHLEDPDGGDATDEVLFRRLRPYIKGSFKEDWYGIWQMDFGKSSVGIRDAFFAYTGWEAADLYIGNRAMPFSRELLTSSKTQQLVERTFVGDHNYGSADRQPGIHLTGSLLEKTLSWSVSGAMASHDPDNKKLDFESAIEFDKDDDWSDGPMVAARLNYMPLGSFKDSQGDFSREQKLGFAIAGFGWSNDKDNLDPTRTKNDADSVMGVEASAAYRGHGLSVDAQVNLFTSELFDVIDEEGIAGTVSEGLYKNGETELTNMAIEGGYMVVPEKVELVAGYQTQDADGYAKAWNRTSIGLNYFVDEHNAKYQVTYQIGENADGKSGNDINELYVQAQYVF